MKQIVFGLGRGLVILGGAFTIAAFSNFVNHKGYWEGTIRRVQTTDFNILAHMIPTKISYALLQNNKAEIQRTLNSNYGLFGLVVTNCTETAWECPDQQILYMTESNKSWRDKVTVENLQQYPFDFLRNPPPVLTEAGYKDSRNQNWQWTGERNSGEVIGRIYYVRGISPAFLKTYTQWLASLPGSLLSDSGAHKYYTLTLSTFTLGGLAMWGTIEWILQGKRAREAQLEQMMHDMQLQLEQIQSDLQDQLWHVTQEIKERIRYIRQLENYQREQDNHISQLNQTILQLENQLAAQAPSLRSEELEQSQAKLEAEIQKQQAAIRALKRQIAHQEQSSSQNQQLVGQLHQELTALTTQLHDSQQAMTALYQQIATHEAERQAMQDLVAQWRQDAKAAQQREVQAQQQYQEMQSSLAQLKQQKEDFERQLDELMNPDLNEFEKQIVSRLTETRHATSGQWLIRPNKDVKREGRIRQFVDCLIFARSCVMVIEAKNYGGPIEASGEAQTTPWFQIRGDQPTRIASSYGCNPYEQVNRYTESVMSKLGVAMDEKRVKVYSLIVFPDSADLRAIKPEIDDAYSQVLCLKDLIPILKKLEQKAMSYREARRKPLSAQQIENIMFGRPQLRCDKSK